LNFSIHKIFLNTTVQKDSGPVPFFKLYFVRFLTFLTMGTLFYISCARFPHKPFTSQEILYTPQTTPDQAQYPDASAIILLDEAGQRLYSKNQRNLSIMDRRTVIKILNERGYYYANMTIPYEKGTEITNIRARTILNDGRIVELLPEQIFDTNYNTQYIYYTDQRVKQFSMPAVENGCIIEYSWRKKSADCHFDSHWPFQREDPVLLSRYSIDTPRNWKMTHKVYGEQIFPSYLTESLGDRIKLQWEASNVPPFVPEVSSPPGERTSSHLLFSPLGIETWQDVANWYLDLAEQRMRPENTIRQTVKKLKYTQNSLNQLKSIFSFVQRTVRYIPIEIGIGKYQPHSAESVLRNGFGDCKDMVSLIVAMARAADITVHPVLLSTWPHGETDTSLVTPHYFNHVIAVAFLDDSTSVWMDPTEKKVSFMELPWYDQDRLVLIARRKEAEIVKTPAAPAEANRSIRHWNITLDDRGVARGTIVIEFEGAQAMEMRHQLLQIHPSNRASWLARHVFSHYPITIESKVRVAEEQNINQPLVVSATFSSSHIVLKSQDLFTLFPDALSTFDWHKLFPGHHRRDDIAMKHPLAITDRIHITYPENLNLVSDKQRDVIESLFGKFEWNIKLLGAGTAVFDRTFVLTATKVPKTRYLDFRNFLFKTALSDQTLILFSSL